MTANIYIIILIGVVVLFLAAIVTTIIVISVSSNKKKKGISEANVENLLLLQWFITFKKQHLIILVTTFR